MTRTFLVSCSSLGALEAATRAIDAYESFHQVPALTAEMSIDEIPDYLGNEKADVDDHGADDVPDPEPDLADTIFRALTWGPLGQSYSNVFTEFLKTRPDNGYLSVPKLAAHLNLSVGQMQARFSKLSGRLGRVATAEQRAAHAKTALTMMFDIAYTATNTEYRLTKAGRQAVGRYLVK